MRRSPSGSADYFDVNREILSFILSYFQDTCRCTLEKQKAILQALLVLSLLFKRSDMINLINSNVECLLSLLVDWTRLGKIL